MPFSITLPDILVAAFLIVWFTATIVWGSIWMNLITSSPADKQEYLSQKARSLPDRAGLSILRFPVLHGFIWLADVLALCWTIHGWWQSIH